MKIRNKKYFIWGLIFLVPLPLFALNIIKAEWWQWLFSIGLSVRYLFIGLSKEAGERQEQLKKNYRAVSTELHGKYAGLKTNLPWVITIVFFAVSLFIRYAFDVVIPVWIAVGFVIALIVSVFYSIGLDMEIKEHIEHKQSGN